MPAEPLPKKLIPVRPVGGLWFYDPAQDIPPEASPLMQNFRVFGGVLEKRPGFAPYPAGMASLGSSITGLYSTQDDQNNTRLFASWTQGLFRYDPALVQWTAITGPALTGVAAQLMSFETSQNSLVFSQGVDPVMVVGLSAAAYARLSVDCPAARYLTRFADRLFLGSTVEAGITKPYRTRWSVNSDHTNWTGVGSGFRDNSEQPYFLKRILKLQNDLAVYTEKSIILAQRTGASVAPAQYNIAAADIGLLAPWTLIGRNEIHFFLGNDNFYLFNGGAPAEIGTQVRSEVFSVLNPGGLNQSFGILISDTEEYLAFLVSVSSSTPDQVWVYNYGRKIWYRWTCIGPTCAAIHRLDDTTTIDGLVGTIDSQNWEFDSRILIALFPALLTGNSDGKVYRWSTQYPSDNGAPIDCFWTSKDWTAKDVDPAFPRNYVRLNKLGLSCRDQGTAYVLEMSYSVDGGVTWSSSEFISVGGGISSTFVEATWFKQITDKRIRIKFRNNSTTAAPAIAELYFDLEVDAQTF